MASTRNVDISAADRAFWQEQFAHFCASHPTRQIGVDGQAWTYLVAGQGSQWVVLLHSAAAGAESLFSQISQLEAEYRVLAPTIPKGVTTMRVASEGLAAMLDHEHILNAHIIGHSVGGMLAQCFLWLYPGYMQSVVLSHTVLPIASHAEGLAQAQIDYGLVSENKIFEGALQLIRERHMLQPLPLDPTDWVANFVSLEEIYRTGMVHKAELLDWLALEEDFHRHYEPPRKEKSEWDHPILIIESDADEVYNLLERKALKEVYSEAQVHTFQGWGHLGILASGSVIQAFLQSLGKQAA